MKQNHMIKATTAAGIIAASFMLPEVPPPVAVAPEPVAIPVVPYVPTWKCETCTPEEQYVLAELQDCILYTSPSPRDQRGSRMPSSA